MRALRGFVVAVSVLAIAAGMGAVPAAATYSPPPSATATISDAPDPVTVSRPVAYTTTFTSTKTLDKVTVTDVIPAGMSFVSASSSGTCSSASGTVTCSFGTVPAGTQVSALIVLQAPGATGTVTNTVKWTGTTGGYHPCGVSVTKMTTTTVVAPSANMVAQYVLAAGGTVTTGTGGGVTAANPLTTTTAIPASNVGTPVSINEVAASGPSDACGPAADCFGDISEITVGSTFTPGTPMTFTFVIDSSKVPYGINPWNAPMYHDGVLVPNCTGGPGAASPDPCVSRRAYVKCSKDIQITVYSSENGRWRP